MTIPTQPQFAIRLLRKRAGLSQRDFAFLVGYESESQVSRLENGLRLPRLEEVLIIEHLFGVAGAVVFSKLHQRAGQEVMARIEKLQRRDGQTPKRMALPRASYKADQLNAIKASIRCRMAVDLADDKPCQIGNRVVPADTAAEC